MDEAQRCGHRREVFDPKVAPFPELRENLDEIGAQFVDRERSRLGVAHDPKYQIHPGLSTGAPLAQAKTRRRRGVFLAARNRSPTFFSNPKSNPAEPRVGE
jgi:hypothetical protein